MTNSREKNNKPNNSWMDLEEEVGTGPVWEKDRWARSGLGSFGGLGPNKQSLSMHPHQSNEFASSCSWNNKWNGEKRLFQISCNARQPSRRRLINRVRTMPWSRQEEAIKSRQCISVLQLLRFPCSKSDSRWKRIWRITAS